jgi:hypothetical protein
MSLECLTAPFQLRNNYIASKKFNFKELKDYIGSVKLHGPANICAAGMSLKDNINKLKTIKGDIFAVKNVKYLIDNGVIPKYSIHFDPKPTEVDLVHLDQRITYLVNHQCDPTVFEKLRGYDVYLIDTKLHSAWSPGGRYWFAGSNSSMASLYFTFNAGYRSVNLFGVDFCMPRNGETHIDRTSDWMLKNDRFIEVHGYRTTYAMAQMAHEMMKNMQFMGRNTRYVVHGTGLLAHFLKKNEKIL